jgi:hypothetical protein
MTPSKLSKADYSDNSHFSTDRIFVKAKFEDDICVIQSCKLKDRKWTNTMTSQSHTQKTTDSATTTKNIGELRCILNYERPKSASHSSQTSQSTAMLFLQRKYDIYDCEILQFSCLTSSMCICTYSDRIYDY